MLRGGRCLLVDVLTSRTGGGGECWVEMFPRYIREFEVLKEFPGFVNFGLVFPFVGDFFAPGAVEGDANGDPGGEVLGGGDGGGAGERADWTEGTREEGHGGRMGWYRDGGGLFAELS